MNGILVIDKEKDYTSRDVVNIVSKHLKTKKVGHTGTLDPLATGVLVLCINDATKLVEIITQDEKEYISTVILGIKTDTLDITGNILENHSTYYEVEEIKRAVLSMKGTYNQEVPLYSAVKINGKKLYEYARNNIEVKLPSREVNIKEIELLLVEQRNNQTEFTFKTTVSKGTYIRSLIEDIASKLGDVATMKELKRTRQGNFTLDDAVKLNQLDNLKLLDIKKVLTNYKKIKVEGELEQKIKNGALIDNIYNEEVLFINKDEEYLAIYKVYEKDNTKMKPFKMLKN